MKTLKHRSDCPISSVLDIIGDKWTMLIVRDLFSKGKCTYGDFLKSAEKIATNILANRLERLEQNNIILKREHPNSKAKVLYELTPKGIDMFPIIVEFVIWASKYLNLPLDDNPILQGISKFGKQQFIDNVTRQFYLVLHDDR